jgi:C-terminal processing protease CtpA/Prc
MRNGKPVVEGVTPGDILLAVDSQQVTGATMGTVTDALRGSPGSARVLKLERNGVPFTIRAVTMRMP